MKKLNDCEIVDSGKPARFCDPQNTDHQSPSEMIVILQFWLGVSSQVLKRKDTHF